MLPERLSGFHTESTDPARRGGNRRGWVHAHGPTLVELFRLSDAACLMAALWLAGRLLDVPWNKEHLLMSLLGVVAFTLAAAHWPLYRSWRVSSLRAELSIAFGCCCAAMLGIMAALYAFNAWPDMSRKLLLAWGFLGFLMIAGGRVVVRLALRALRTRGSNFRVAAIVGANDTSLHVAHQLRSNPWMGIRVLGVFDARNSSSGHGVAEVARPGLSGDLARLEQHIARGEVDIVYITLPMRAERLIQHVVRKLRDSAVPVLFVADFSAFGLLHARWEMLGGMPTVSLVDTPHQGVDGLLKRVLDVVLSSIALVILSPLLLAIALAIKLTSPGAVMFVQRRYGLDGKEFEIYKFRTMTVVEDGMSAFTFTQAHRGDHRITRLGAVLRRTSLDELPQLFNVLQGHMSLVGPRPHPIALNEAQRKLIDGYMLRHKVRPGITGWAQVHGCRGETDTSEKMENRIRYDLEYINDWSLWLDLRIMWKTVMIVLRDPNAY